MQSKWLKHAAQVGKCMHKLDVATQLYGRPISIYHFFPDDSFRQANYVDALNSYIRCVMAYGLVFKWRHTDHLKVQVGD